MKLTTHEDSTNYPCTVVQLGVMHPIEGADKIQRTVLFGNNIIISKAANEGDVMLYFVAGTQLSEDFCFENNLYDSHELNRDTSEKGYISSKRRLVKAIKLRGTISDGMLLPLTAVDYVAPLIDLKVGDTFTHIFGTEVCRKYTVPVKQTGTPGQKQPKENKMKELLIDNQFRFHTDTAHFARSLGSFKPETEIIVTRKYHGSSLILSHVLINKKLNWFEKLIDKIVKLPTSEYGYVFSSGKPKSRLPKGVKTEKLDWASPTQSFYSENIWEKAYNLHRDKVEKGITLYGEIVGQGVQGADYTYGFDYEIFIYRITQTNVDGNVYELSWEAVKAYCEKYGLKYVDQYFVGKITDVVGKNGTVDDALLRFQDVYLDKSFPDCKVDEGVCIRVRGTDEIYKLKSPKFILKEANELDSEVEFTES